MNLQCNTLPSSELFYGLYYFGCHHCDYKSNFENLQKLHWPQAHNINIEKAKPFMFKILPKVRCAECQDYEGSIFEVEMHLKNEHGMHHVYACDANEPISSDNELACAFCMEKSNSPAALQKHHQKAEHAVHDIKKFQIAHLKSLLKLGTHETFLQCSLCMQIFANRVAIVAHACDEHSSGDNFSFKEISNKVLYHCGMCGFCDGEELKTLRHMIEHFGAFKRCHLCLEPQDNFNALMQHRYVKHRENVAKFTQTYPLRDISKFLKQMLIIFANGLVMSKKNLAITSYGKENSIRQIYAEMCKISQQPPIPRLSIARLVARKSIEASSAGIQEEPAIPTSCYSLEQMSAKKIAKRRSTVAFGSPNEARLHCLTELKKRKNSLASPLHKVPELTVNNEPNQSAPAKTVLQPYSFYGKTPEPMDLSKIYTKMAVGGLDTLVSIEKFKMLFKMDPILKVEKLDLQKYMPDAYREYAHVKKACPASQKYRYV